MDAVSNKFLTFVITREKMQEEFGKQISSVFSQWESDIQKSKEAEEKLEVNHFVSVSANI